MRLHRFYVPDLKLAHDQWLHDQGLLHQWRNVLRYRPGQQVVLFDGQKHEHLYSLESLDKTEARLVYITDFDRKLPKRQVYLCWSLLKKDKNEWILQKATELGVSYFVPLIADRSEKTGFNHDQAVKIVQEAAEQCGRSDMPTIREPMHVVTALEQLGKKVTLYMCEQDIAGSESEPAEHTGVLIGPEGGWSDAEKTLFEQQGVGHMNLRDFTLPAESAALTAVGRLLQ
jgi:16S rRNA (uracil1498-N3)-methyltransferase